AYIQPATGEKEADARHNREYTPREIHQLLETAGFAVTLLETGPFREEPRPEYGWVMRLLDQYKLPTHLRGDGIYAVGRKTGERRLVLRKRLELPADRRGGGGRPRNAGAGAHRDREDDRAGAPAQNHRPDFHSAAASHLAQSQPHPDHGAAGHPGPLSRLVRRRAMDPVHASAADANLLLRVRNRAANQVRKRSQPLRIRAVLLRRDAALAGLQRSVRAGADGHLGASEFREEAGFSGGDAAGESGGLGPGERVRDAGSVRRRGGYRQGASARDGRLAAAHSGAADLVHAGSVLVPRRAGCVCAGFRAVDRILSHAVVFPDSHLLPGV